MSKSTGNFLTLKDSVDKYGADATRIAFADAGDGIEDANFDETVANSNILRLHALKDFLEEAIKDETLRTGPADSFWDKSFNNTINVIVEEAKKHYEKYVLVGFVIAIDDILTHLAPTSNWLSSQHSTIL
jgi:leucyl-tRNA synthetase